MNLLGYLLDAANWPTEILPRLLEHLRYTGLAVLVAAIIAIPLGMLIGHTGRGGFLVIGLGNAARAVPTLGLVVLIVLLTNNGLIPITIGLVILAIPPMMTATAAGFQNADQEAVLAARAIGMTSGQVVRKVEWPLALPLTISGIRSSVLQVVATATVAAFVSGGALGQLLTSGLASQRYDVMFAGAVLIAALAVILDISLGIVGWAVTRRVRPKARVAVGAAA